MRNQTDSTLHFQRKISEFCDVRVAPLVSKRALDNIKPYFVSLIIYRKHPPMRTSGMDWQSISDACGLGDEMTATFKKALRPGLEAIMRWIDKERSKDDLPSPTGATEKPANTSRVPTARPNKSAPPYQTPVPARKVKTGVAPKLKNFRNRSSIGGMIRPNFSML